jgi:hypothetical protein
VTKPLMPGSCLRNKNTLLIEKHSTAKHNNIKLCIGIKMSFECYLKNT